MGSPGRRGREGRRFPGPSGVPLPLLVVLLLALATSCASRVGESTGPAPMVGPSEGTLLLAGGGDLGPEIWERFIDLAGGPGARIVVIPTANARAQLDNDAAVLEKLRRAGAGRVEVLHTRDPEEADSRRFVKPLSEADGVWMPGGRPNRLVDAYLHTRTHEALWELLEEGGVVGGTSAGASIQASYLVRGDPETNQILMAEDYAEGFGFLSSTAVDQHLHARDRQSDLWSVTSAHPDHLGIGIDEGTAVIVEGDELEVIGRGRVLIYTYSVHPRDARELEAGGRYHLGHRLPLPSVPQRQTEDRDDMPLEAGAHRPELIPSAVRPED